MMSDQSTTRGLAVVKAIEEILEILTDRDQLKLDRETVKKLNPELVAEYEAKGMIPKWYLYLVLVLTKLYDQGYVNSTKDSENLK